jgi:threonine dehydratase
MPQTTPDIKVNAVKSLGGHVILHGDAFDEAAVFAKQLAIDKGYSFIHPYDDLEVIAGQGTVGMEILRQQTQQLRRSVCACGWRRFNGWRSGLY